MNGPRAFRRWRAAGTLLPSVVLPAGTASTINPMACSPELLHASEYELPLQAVECERAEGTVKETPAERDRTLASLAKHRSAEEELQMTQAALRESEDRLNTILQSAMDAIITVDEEGRILLFNAAAEKMFGCAASVALGSLIERFIPERFHAAHTSHMRRFSETGTTSRAVGTMGAIWGRRANGQEFPLEASISRVEAERKKLSTVILRDITERQQAEARNLRLASIVDSSGEAILSKDLAGTITSWNRGAERLCGYTETEALGKSVRIIVPENRQDEEAHFLSEIERGRQVTRYETTRRRKDGSEVHVSLIISPIRDGSGQIIGASSIAHDISERKEVEKRLAAQSEELSRQAEELARSQQALESQKLMLRSVLDSMAEGLVAADEQGKFIIWNPAAEKIVGLGAANLSSEEWTAHYGLYLPDTVTPFPPEQNPLLRAIRGEVTTAEMYLRNPGLAEGTWIEASASPLKDKDGAVRGGVVAFRDITQRRVDEREIQKLNQDLEARVAERTAELEAANKELEAFTYSVSHDLRAPLRHINGFTRILVEEFGPSLPGEAQRHLQRIEQGANRMGRLVDELLNLARLGRQALTVEATGLSSLVQDVVTLLAPESEGRQVEWKIAALPLVECDPILIRQVFQNLIGNALKYSRPRSPAVIEIGETEKEGEKVIFVKDNGVGFSMKYADKLFGVFQRLHHSEDFEGTGVGLATVQRIIQKHGGQVWAEAELDQGATFYFTLGGRDHFASGNAGAAGG